MLTGGKLDELKQMTRTLKCDVVDMVHKAGSGHLGGSFSAAEMMTYLYFHRMKVDPQNPKWEDRDRFLLSKGHCGPIQYAALARKGYFPVSTLDTLRDIDSILQGHPDWNKTPGIEMTTGSLGQGLSIATGMALAGKLLKKDYTIYTMLGDGEMQSGMVWEAVMYAGHRGLDNLVAIVDNNRIQCDGKTQDISAVEPLEEKFKAFNWETYSVDGHDFSSIDEAFSQINNSNGKPKAIISYTTKGKGVSFMECTPKWHGGAPNDEQAQKALQEIRGA